MRYRISGPTVSKSTLQGGHAGLTTFQQETNIFCVVDLDPVAAGQSMQQSRLSWRGKGEQSRSKIFQQEDNFQQGRLQDQKVALVSEAHNAFD